MCRNEQRLARQSEETRRLSRRSYVGYLIACLRATSAWELWQNLLTFARRWRLLATILRILTIAVTWLETSAIFLLSATVLGVLGLPLLVGAVIMLLIGIFQHRLCNKALAKALAGRRLYVLIADRAALDTDSYFRGMVRDLAGCADSTAIVVSPYFWKSTGIFRGSPYVTLRRETPNIYLIRRHYFFSLRRHVLPCVKQVTILY